MVQQLFLTSLTVVLVTLSGCGNKENNKSEVCDREAYIRDSSEFKATEGEGILTVSSSNPVTNGYFNKPYNKDWLAAVGRASINETIEYIETTGARVYRSEAVATESARPMTSARPMPSEMDAVWQQASRTSPTSCGFLVGLYLLKDMADLPSVNERAAVIVREDAGRWTLVHEFMHHNFKTQSVARGYEDDYTQRRRWALDTRIKQIREDRSMNDKDYAKAMVPVFLELADLTDKFLVEFTLEEVAIEAIMQDRFDRGELGFVSMGSYSNARRYIEFSHDNAQSLYRSMNSIYDELRLLTRTNGLGRLYSTLERYYTRRELRLSQIEDILNRNQKAEHRMGATASIHFSNSNGPAYAPCAHAEHAERELSDLTARFRAIPPRI